MLRCGCVSGVRMPTFTTSPSKPAVLTAYFMIYVVWGSTYYVIGEAAEGMPPYVLGALRFSLAGLFMLGLAWWSGERVFQRRLVGFSALCGLLLLFTDMLAIMLALRFITSSLVAVLAASTLIWITLLDAPMWRYNLRSPAVIAGVLGGMGGVVLLYSGHLAEQGEAAAQGILIFLGGALCWALGSLISKYKASSYESVNAWSGTAWQMLAAAVLFWLCALGSGELQQVEWSGISPGAWGALAYLVVFGSVMAYSSYVWLLKIRPATEVGTHAYANPFIAIVLGVCLGHEEISFYQWVGLAVILLSLFIVNRYRVNKGIYNEG